MRWRVLSTTQTVLGAALLLVCGLTRLPAPAPLLLPVANTARSTWTATADSQELVGENAPASAAIDGSTSTFWHTQWKNATAPLPHWIAIDTKAVQPWAGLVYTPRPATTGRNGNIGQYQVDVSDDGVTWNPAPVAQGTWPDSSATQTVTFGSVMARFVRLKALTESGNRGPWSNAAEIDLTPGTAPATPTTPAPTPTQTAAPSPTPELAPRSQWVATADSQETAGEDGHAANVLDGDPATIWHTAWTGSALPHWIALDTRTARTVSAMAVTARPASTGGNGRIGKYTVQVSVDGATWTQVAAGALGDWGGTQTISFAPVVARYVKLTALSEAGNRGPWTSAAEIDLTSSAAPTTAPAATPTAAPTTAAPTPTQTAAPTPTPELAPRSQWVATADSQETVGEDGRAANVLDGDPATIWHTAWTGSALPHWIALDTRTARTVSAMAVTARPASTGGNGRIGQYTVQVSVDGATWTQVAAGALGDWGGTQTISFAPVVARYVKLTALSEAGNRGPWTSAAEIDLTSSAATGYATSTGSWSPVVSLPIDAAAAALLPDGKVLTWSAYSGTVFGGAHGYTQTATVDTRTGAVSQRTVTETGQDMFCPGIALLADGTVFISGGSNADKQSRYDPVSATWSNAADLRTPRAYHSSVTLSDGRVFSLGGSWAGGVGQKNGELWTAGSGAGMSASLPGIPAVPFETNDGKGEFRSDNHMWLFAWSGGSVFQAGPSRTMHWISTAGSGSYTGAGLRGDDGDAMNGNAVMYDAGKILTVGGAPSYDNSVATSNAYTVDISGGPGSAPVVGKLAGMADARAFANSVVLPDGKVVVMGGQGFAVPFSDATSVLTPELWDPSTRAFTRMAPMATPRNYHSFALLMPDARVMVGGGQLCTASCANEHPNYEIFTPPYLLDGSGGPRPRPAWVSAPTSGTAGSTLAVTTDRPVTGFSLVRMGSATHSVDTDQRRVALSAVSTGSNSYRLALPADRGVLVPGTWMLFALDASGTPSTAATLRLS